MCQLKLKIAKHVSRAINFRAFRVAGNEGKKSQEDKSEVVFVFE